MPLKVWAAVATRSPSFASTASRKARSWRGKPSFEDRKKVAEQFTIVLDACEQFLMIKNERGQFFSRFLRGLLHSGPRILCQPRPTASLPRMISFVAGEDRTQEFPQGQGHACAHLHGQLSF